MPTKLDFSKEDVEGTPAEFAPGAWVCGETHTPGGNKNMPVNNRAFVFRLKLKEDLAGVSAGNDVLFVMGLGKQKVIEGVKKLEKETGLKAVAMLCNGGGHHIFIKLWFDAFPDMKVWVCPTKVPTTSNGERLRKDYPDRWELADNSTVPHHVYQLLHYFGSGDNLQVDCVLFNQFFAAQDKTTVENGAWGSPETPPEDRSQMYVFTKLIKSFSDFSCRTDDVCFFHKASGLLITGHHWEFAYMSKEYTLPQELKWYGGPVFTMMLWSQFIKPGRYGSCLGITIKRLGDVKVHAEQWQEVLKWDVAFSTSWHDPVGLCGPIDNKAIMEFDGGLKGYFKSVLESTGELTGEAVPGSWIPWKKANIIHQLAKKEPGYLKQYGEPPELCYGGPNYDEVGKKKT